MLLLCYLYFLIWTFSSCQIHRAGLNAPFFHVSNSTLTASANVYTGEYACILEETYFYSAPDERYGLFLLPTTYYVKILEQQAEYYKIEYLYDDSLTRKIIGYAKTDHLIPVEYTPKRPYLYYAFDVHYYIDDSSLNDSTFLNQITITCAYYGDFRIGSKTYCYVLRGDTFGYIPKPDNIFYEENTEYADWVAQNENSTNSATPDSGGTGNSSPAQIAILVALCLLVPVLAGLILKPPRRPPYDEDLA